MRVSKERLVNNEIAYQRWLALGLLFFVIILIVIIAIVPLVSTGMEYHDQKNELVFRLQRSKQIIARKERVAETIESLKEQYQEQDYFSTQDTVALASADLQKFIKSTISQAGGQLTSTQVLPSTKKNGFNRITIKVRMTGDSDVLRNVLHEIESSSPVMIIGQIDIRPVRGKRNRKTRKIESTNKLTINFQTTGFMRVKPS
jgi:general secretion pathway protein M